MDWWLLYETIYIILLVLVCLRIIYDTRSTTKTLAYLLLAIFVPVLGIFFYFSFGINYRKRKMYSKKLELDDVIAKQLQEDIFASSRRTLEQGDAAVKDNRELAFMQLMQLLPWQPFPHLQSRIWREMP